MNRFIKSLFLILFLTLSITTVSANSAETLLSSDYTDVVSEISSTETEADVINIYQFYSDGCPVCEAEYEDLQELISEYDNNVNIVRFEVSDNEENMNLMKEVSVAINIEEVDIVPFTIVADKHFIGYKGEETLTEIENLINDYLVVQEAGSANELESSNQDTNNISLHSEYIDIVAPITGDTVKDNVINVYQFWALGCPHCEHEYEYLLDLQTKYGSSINIIRYEVLNNVQNSYYIQDVGTALEIEGGVKYVPFLVIGDQYISGYNSDDTTGADIENIIEYYMGDANQARTYNLPFLGEVEAKSASLGVVAIVLGIVDGFNPCAMWVLLFLINMLLGTKDRKKMFILGFTFLFTSGFVYFLSMLGMNFILSFTQIAFIRILIGAFAVGFGTLNIYNYRQEAKKDEDGCAVVDTKKRRNIFTRINKALEEPHLLIAMASIVVLAAGVNLIELACSLGFPAIYAELLAINDVSGAMRIVYLVIYVIFYMIDDMVIFTIAMTTLSATGISTKYTKYSHLIGGAIMLIIGLLLIFRPELVMFNF